MPRIDPSQLLNTLSVLLAPDGGIRSSDDVSIFFFVIFTVDMTTLTVEPVPVPDRKDRTVRTETLGPFFFSLYKIRVRDPQRCIDRYSGQP
jgi:hypothetical protein